MAFAAERRVHCFSRQDQTKRVMGAPPFRRRTPLRIRQRPLQNCEKEPQERTAPMSNLVNRLKESENWNQFFLSLKTLENAAGDEEIGRIVKALKLSMVACQKNPVEYPYMGRLLLQKSISVASLVTSLLHEQNPYVDSETIAAALVMEQVWKEQLSLSEVANELGNEVCALTRGVIKIRQLVDKVDVFEDNTARSIQRTVFKKCDSRAVLLQFVSSLDTLIHAQTVPLEVQVPLALDCLFVYVGFGRVLRMDDLATSMENCCMELLFPTTHAEITAHLQEATFDSEYIFSRIRSLLGKRMEENKMLRNWVKKAVIKTRVKSISSFMRKELSLKELAKGGRPKEEIHDVLGVRVIVSPKKEDDAYYESLAVQGCYLIQSIANELWPVIRSRSKDYIKKPKPNRYRSLHSVHKIKVPKDRHKDVETRLSASETTSGSTRELRSYPMLEHVLNESLVIDDPTMSEDEFFNEDFQPPTAKEATFELQIRTKKMDEEAEHGPASHALYKSGFDL